MTTYSGMKRSIFLLALLIFADRTAYAHGQEIVFFPLGQAAALLLSIVSAILFVRQWLGGIIAVLLTLVVCAATWFMPGSISPGSMRHAEAGYFFAGFVLPSVVTVFAALFGIFKRMR